MNRDIIDNLNILAKYYKKTGDHWRQQAYQRAIISLKSHPDKITDIKQIKGLKGIGKTMLTKIKEFLDTGQIRKVEEVKNLLEKETHKNEKEATIDVFRGIWGVGDVKAKELWKLGYKSIADVRKNPKILNNLQKIGLKYYEDLLKPLPRKYLDIFNVILRYILNKKFGKNSYTMDIAGSYRRGESYSGDMDVLITSKKFNLSDFIKLMEEWGMISAILSMKSEKFMGIVHCPSGDWHHFRMDIEFLPEEEYGAGLLYFTGSKGFNISMRMDAKKKGMILNQHGLFKLDGTRIPVFTEKEIFKELGMKYVPPDRR